jgi:hypothetical protein
VGIVFVKYLNGKAKTAKSNESIEDFFYNGSYNLDTLENRRNKIFLGT